MGRPIRTLVALLCATLALAPSARAGASPAVTAAEYLAAKQRADGAFAQGATADGVAEAAASIAAAGVGPDVVRRALSFVRAHGPEAADKRGGIAGRLVLALVGTGQDPSDFGGYDYLAKLDSYYLPTGAYDNGLYADALAVLGVLAARKTAPTQSITHILDGECSGGGFAHDEPCVGRAPDVDTTALVLNVFGLAHASRTDAARDRAIAWLRTAQNKDGGFGLHPGAQTNANSTGLLLSAFAAIDRQIDWWKKDDSTRALLALQMSNGSFRYLAGDPKGNDYATVQAIPGVLGVGYPLHASKPVAQSSKSTTPAPVEQPTLVASPFTSATPIFKPRYRAGLIVQFGNGTTKKACVAFSEKQITGFDLLQRSGIPFIYQDSGGESVFICKIGADGRDYPSQSCVPPCPSGACTFWAYYQLHGSAWRFADRGAGTTIIHNGDVDGWRWSKHDAKGSSPPPKTSIDDVCAQGVIQPLPISAARSKPGAGSSSAIALGVLAALVASLGGWAAYAARKRERRGRVNA